MRRALALLVSVLQVPVSMRSVFLALGVVLLSITVLDILWTTLWIEEGAGPLTSRLMDVTWRMIRAVGGHQPRVLTLAGPVILLSGLTTWIVLFWGGWTLILGSAETGLIDTLDRGPISWSDRFYFVGYTMFTVGNGDFAPKEGIWQVVTTVISGSGMVFITLSVTYVLSVLDAVKQKRSFASDISGLGSNGTDIVRTSWNGEGFESLDVSLSTITSELNTLTSNHKAYPIIHYFYSRQPQQAPASQIPALDEALTLFRLGIPERDRPPEVLLQPARKSVESYLETVSRMFITQSEHTPHTPDLTRLQDAGIPTVSSEEFRTSIESLDERRRTLLGLVESDVREWPSTDG